MSLTACQPEKSDAPRDEQTLHPGRAGDPRQGQPLSRTQSFLRRECLFLARPLNLVSRLLLLAGVAFLIGSFFFPLWQIRLVAPQYRDGLELNIYSYELRPGNNGQHLDEINLLNHYIGMKPIHQADFVEMRWIPFVVGLFVILTLRAMVFGRMGNIVDLLMLFTYFGLFSMANFYYRLYTYGHDLDPKAAMTIDPFVPVIIGKNQIANFTQYSYPMAASYLFVGYVVVLLVVAWLSRKEKTLVESHARDGSGGMGQ
jgi:copper chaperone NosL